MIAALALAGSPDVDANLGGAPAEPLAPAPRTSVQALVRYGVASVRVRQELPQPVSPRWDLPLPPGAAIQLRTVTCGGRPLPGVAVDPEEELRWPAPAPCPGEDLVVDVRYVQSVLTEDGVKRLVLPTEPGAEVEVVLADWVAVGALWSDTHAITTDRQESERVVVWQGPLRGEDRPWFALSWTVATSSWPHRYVMNELLERRLYEIRHCYQQRLTRSPGLEGRVDVRFVIHPDGSVSDAVVSESTLADPAVERCLLDVLERLRYPAWGTIVVHYPFIFRQG